MRPSAMRTPARSSRFFHAQFAFYASRLMNLLAEEAIAMLPPTLVDITTPTGALLRGAVTIDTSKACAVSIIRCATVTRASLAHAPRA
jgi:uracil phosphoribosyltransferase